MTRRQKLAVGLPVALLLAALCAYVLLQHRVGVAVNTALAELVGSGLVQEASYRDARLDWHGDLQLAGLQLVTPSLTVELASLTLSALDFAHEVPWSLHLHAEDLHFPRGIDGEALLGAAYWPAFDGDLLQGGTLRLSLDLDYRYEPGPDERIVTKVDLVIPALFALAAEAETRHATPEQLLGKQQPTPGPEPDEAVLPPGFALPLATLQVSDLGIVERWLQGYAATYDRDPAAMRPHLQSQLRSAYLFLTPDSEELARQLGAALATYLEGGRTLHLGLEPAYGGELARLQTEVLAAVFTANFGRAVELLNFSIAVE
jgi:hypothetical protein